jgi:hypothetical protein
MPRRRQDGATKISPAERIVTGLAIAMLTVGFATQGFGERAGGRPRSDDAAAHRISAHGAATLLPVHAVAEMPDRPADGASGCHPARPTIGRLAEALRHAQRVLMPPSMTISLPTTKRDSSDAK